MSAEHKPVKVQVRDPETDEVLAEHVIEHDYVIVCAGECYVAATQIYKNGTNVLTVKGRR